MALRTPSILNQEPAVNGMGLKSLSLERPQSFIQSAGDKDPFLLQEEPAVIGIGAVFQFGTWPITAV